MAIADPSDTRNGERPRLDRLTSIYYYYYLILRCFLVRFVKDESKNTLLSERVFLYPIAPTRPRVFYLKREVLPLLL